MKPTKIYHIRQLVESGHIKAISSLDYLNTDDEHSGMTSEGNFFAGLEVPAESQKGYEITNLRLPKNSETCLVSIN
jgi:hypothetical protein